MTIRAFAGTEVSCDLVQDEQLCGSRLAVPSTDTEAIRRWAQERGWSEADDGDRCPKHSVDS